MADVCFFCHLFVQHEYLTCLMCIFYSFNANFEQVLDLIAFAERCVLKFKMK